VHLVGYLKRKLKYHLISRKSTAVMVLKFSPSLHTDIQHACLLQVIHNINLAGSMLITKQQSL